MPFQLDVPLPEGARRFQWLNRFIDGGLRRYGRNISGAT